ncbi:MAG: hypothetical protein HQL63_12795 [Magnetococcales bacterium]|nr:hypothetical protein [Magnetococcales bacterium]MBF0322937.1 hypothetical protein [Magnetococcales bacterium]
MKALRQRIIDEMNLAGLAANTQQICLGAVGKLAVHKGCLITASWTPFWRWPTTFTVQG